MTLHTLSAAGASFLKNEEGLRLTAYRDAAGYSVCYGHYGVAAGSTYTVAQCDTFFAQDTATALQAINLLNTKLRQNQVDALVSFVYNIGVGAFAGSTIAGMIKDNPDNPAIAREFMKWVYSDGKVNPVLVARRVREANFYFQNITRPALIGLGLILLGIGIKLML